MNQSKRVNQNDKERLNCLNSMMDHFRKFGSISTLQIFLSKAVHGLEVMFLEQYDEGSFIANDAWTRGWGGAASPALENHEQCGHC